MDLSLLGLNLASMSSEIFSTWKILWFSSQRNKNISPFLSGEGDEWGQASQTCLKTSPKVEPVGFCSFHLGRYKYWKKLHEWKTRLSTFWLRSFAVILVWIYWYLVCLLAFIDWLVFPKSNLQLFTWPEHSSKSSALNQWAGFRSLLNQQIWINSGLWKCFC